MKDDKVLEEYKQVYKKVHGEIPKITQNGRWVYIGDNFITPYCKSKIPSMTKNLKSRLE